MLQLDTVLERVRAILGQAQTYSLEALLEERHHVSVSSLALPWTISGWFNASNIKVPARLPHSRGFNPIWELGV